MHIRPYQNRILLYIGINASPELNDYLRQRILPSLVGPARFAAILFLEPNFNERSSEEAKLFPNELAIAIKAHEETHVLVREYKEKESERVSSLEKLMRA